MSGIKNKAIYDFSVAEKDTINTFRTLLLFGKNVSTYKFALCTSLLKQKPSSEISYQDLRDEFLKELVNHYTYSKNQFTGGSNSLTSAFDIYLGGNKSDHEWNQLVNKAEKNIYNNVFDAFQNVGGGAIKKDFLLFEHDKSKKKLVLTDNINQILERPDFIQLIEEENQARWRVVEEAWKNNLSPNLLVYNHIDDGLYSINPINLKERVYLRSAVSTLLPYQNGRCFYCNKPINLKAQKQEHNFPDVDHFLPHSFLKRLDIYPVNLNGIWNLVIACMECNRGVNGKFHAPPDPKFFQALYNRNLLFLEEHKHSLKNSILLSLGASNKQEVSKSMHRLYNHFRHIKGWEPKFNFRHL